MAEPEMSLLRTDQGEQRVSVPQALAVARLATTGLSRERELAAIY